MSDFLAINTVDDTYKPLESRTPAMTSRPSVREVIDLTSPSPQASEDENFTPRTNAASRQAKKRAMPQARPHPTSTSTSPKHPALTESRRRAQSSELREAFIPHSPSSESTIDPKERYVYVLKVEHRTNVGIKHVASLNESVWDVGDLEDVIIYEIFQNLHDANMAAREKYEDICEETGLSETMGTEELDLGKNGLMVSIDLDDFDERESWSVRLEECVLR